MARPTPPGAVGISLVPAFLLPACVDDGPGPPDTLEPIARFALDRTIEDPSGLAAAGDRLYVVSDRKSRVYVVDRFGVRDKGATVEVAQGETDGFEGVALASDGLLVAREETGDLLRVSLASGHVRARIAIEDVVDGNSGLEGLAVLPGGDIVALKEKEPSVLVRLDREGREIHRERLRFAKDVSAVSDLANPACPDELLVVSQEERMLFQIDDSGRVLGRWLVPARRPEGIAFDGAELFVADEKTSEILVFDFAGLCLGAF